MTRLCEVARILSGFPLHASVDQDPDGNVLIVRPADGDSRNSINWESVRQISVDPRKTLHDLAVGDILFRANGKIHPAYLVQDVPVGARVIAHQHFLHISMRDKRWLPQFVTLLLNSEGAQEYFAENASGASQSVIKKSVLQDFELPDINLEVQKSWVGKWLQRCAKIEKLRKEIACIEEKFSTDFESQFGGISASLGG